jgi:hypothetical protein
VGHARCLLRLGRLYQSSSTTLAATRYLYDGDALTAEYNSSGTMLRRYVHADGADVPLVWYEGSTTTAPQYLYADHQGSIVAVANASGAVTNVNGYDEYGIPNAANAGRFQYTAMCTTGRWTIRWSGTRAPPSPRPVPLRRPPRLDRR